MFESTESTANVTMVEVDEAVGRKDPTGGRGMTPGEGGGKVEVQGKSEAEIVESAV